MVSGHPHRYALILVGDAWCMSMDDKNTNILTQFKVQMKVVERGADLFASHSISLGEITMPRLMQ